MKFDVLYNFISPVTGRILSEIDYVLVGDLAGIATPSPILIDMRLDIVKLRKDIENLSITSFIIGFPNEQLPNAQVLSGLSNGVMFNTGGVVSTTSTIPIGSLPDLSEDNIWVGDSDNRPVESSRYVKGPFIPVTIIGNVVTWGDFFGRAIKDSGFSIAALEAIGAEAAAAAEAASLSAEAAANAAAIAIGGAIGSIFGGGGGGKRGRTGATGTPGLVGAPGAAGVSGKSTVVIDSNISLLGGRVQDIAPSPEADYDAVSAKWVWDLLNDNVEIKWG
jgi:hypothetical protein